MGFGNIGWFQILVVLLIVLLVFGTKKIRTLGGDLGGAIRDFRKGMSEDDAESEDQPKAAGASSSDDDKTPEKTSEKAPEASSAKSKNT